MAANNGIADSHGERDNEWSASLELVTLLDSLMPMLEPGELRDKFEITRLQIIDFAKNNFGDLWDQLPDAHFIDREGNAVCLEHGIHGEPNTLLSPHPLSLICEKCLTITMLECALEGHLS